MAKENTLMLAIDQGTSSTKTIVFNLKGEVLAKSTEILKTNYFGAGFVEQNPEVIYENVIQSVKSCLDSFCAKGGNLSDIQSCGISNQRETFVVWDEVGQAISPAIVWQCKRSIAICEELNATDGIAEKVKRNTGLIIDPYFSGTKLIWLNQNDKIVKDKIK